MSDEQKSQNPVINIDQADYMDWGIGGKYKARMGQLSPRVGAQKLGYNITKLEPGKAAFPYHQHHNNEELFVILEGTGKLRQNGEEYPLRQGDLVACPAGPNAAHQIMNDSDGELTYLAISTRLSPEVVQYPDSDKMAVFVSQPTTGEVLVRRVIPAGVDVGYWDGEATE
jgi:uncharacterized cupin superfamily protein